MTDGVAHYSQFLQEIDVMVWISAGDALAEYACVRPKSSKPIKKTLSKMHRIIPMPRATLEAKLDSRDN